MHWIVLLYAHLGRRHGPGFCRALAEDSGRNGLLADISYSYMVAYNDDGLELE